MSNTKIYNGIAALCSIWFLLTGWCWTWYINIFISFPVAIIGFLFWRKGRSPENKKLNCIIGWIFLAGLAASIGALFLFR